MKTAILGLLALALFAFSVQEVNGELSKRKKLPPPKTDPEPQCLAPPCRKRKIKTRFYIADEIWNYFEQECHKTMLKRQLSNTVDAINKKLGRLDNGGFAVEYDFYDVVKLSTSDVKIGTTYIDRQDGNKKKRCNMADTTNVLGIIFCFQEAVKPLEQGNNNVDYRVLLVPYNSNAHPKAASEENCFCQTDGFGCVAVFGVRYWTKDWSEWASLFSHEFGHSAGAELHDDEHYLHDRCADLIMWPFVGDAANIWSPFFKETDHGN